MKTRAVPAGARASSARVAILGVTWAIVASCASGPAKSEPSREPASEPVSRELELEFVADFNVAAGTKFEAAGGEVLGGISAVAYEKTTGRWLALSDARDRPRFFELEIDLDPEAFMVRPVSVSYLENGRGEAFPAGQLDPEGLVLLPGGALLVSSEANSRGAAVIQGGLLELDRDGRLRREHALPEKFVVSGFPPERGARNNQGFEALSALGDGDRVFLGVEETLLQDGPPTSFDTVGRSRILTIERRGDSFVHGPEYVYEMGPVGAVPEFTAAAAVSGLVEILALTPTELLALERVYVRELVGTESLNRIFLYLVDLSEATDVSGFDGLKELDDAEWKPARKTLVLDFDDVVPLLSKEYPLLDNFEAMGFGPELPGGGESLIVVSDDNFQGRQRTAFFLFRVRGRES